MYAGIRLAQHTQIQPPISTHVRKGRRVEVRLPANIVISTSYQTDYRPTNLALEDGNNSTLIFSVKSTVRRCAPPSLTAPTPFRTYRRIMFFWAEITTPYPPREAYTLHRTWAKPGTRFTRPMQNRLHNLRPSSRAGMISLDACEALGRYSRAGITSLPVPSPAEGGPGHSRRPESRPALLLRVPQYEGLMLSNPFPYAPRRTYGSSRTLRRA